MRRPDSNTATASIHPCTSQSVPAVFTFEAVSTTFSTTWTATVLRRAFNGGVSVLRQPPLVPHHSVARNTEYGLPGLPPYGAAPQRTTDRKSSDQTAMATPRGRIPDGKDVAETDGLAGPGPPYYGYGQQDIRSDILASVRTTKARRALPAAQSRYGFPPAQSTHGFAGPPLAAPVSVPAQTLPDSNSAVQRPVIMTARKRIERNGWLRVWIGFHIIRERFFDHFSIAWRSNRF